MRQREPLTTIYVGVGSNIEPKKNIAKAMTRLAKKLWITGVSTFYETPPIGRPEQEPFINGVLRAATRLSAEAVKYEVLRPIEKGLGRTRTRDPYAARTLDLDLLLYGDMVSANKQLQVPDPDIRTRPFLVIPLAELNPGLRLPDTGEAVGTVAKGLCCNDIKPLPNFSKRLRKGMRDE